MHLPNEKLISTWTDSDTDAGSYTQGEIQSYKNIMIQCCQDAKLQGCTECPNIQRLRDAMGVKNTNIQIYEYA